jgi:DNA-binding NarL/FixJ family response regulator
MKILVADDHPIVRFGLKQVLASEPDLVVAGEASNGDEALALARSLDWDVAILDFSMPGRSGFDLIEDLTREFPRRPLLVLSMHSEQLHAARILKAGAAGYVNKESAPQELATALRKVAAGGKYVSAALGEVLAKEFTGTAGRKPHEKLSDREYRVMWLLASGRHINGIAQELRLHASTVSTYRARVLKKLGVGSVAELVQYAVRNQLIE